MMLAALLISFTACGQATVKQVKIKSDFASDHCKQRIEQAVGNEKGIKSVDADVKSQIVTIQYLSDKNSAENLTKVVKDLGYASNVMCDVEASACKKQGDNCCKGKQPECKKMQIDSTKKCKPGCQKPCEKK